MARTSITKTTALGSYGTDGVSVTWTNADSSNGNSFAMTGNDLLLVRNAHASTAKTVTINSVADQMGRTGDITAESVAAGVVKAYGPFKDKPGWEQSGGVLHLTAEDNNIKFAVIALPLNE